MKASIEPLVFGPDESPLFGMLTIPTPNTAVDRGVVICPPLGYENIIYHRQLAILARRLAADGRPTLRFDWPGTGDSAGDDWRDGLFDAYIDAVATAVHALRDRAGVVEVDLIGLRIGATFAAVAAARDGIAGNLVLWAPFTTGRAYTREMRAFHRLAVPVESGAEPRADLDGEEVSGFVLARSTIEALDRLDLLKIEFRGLSGGRVLLAGKDKPPDDRLAAHFREAGIAVDMTVLEGLREVALGWAERPVPWSAFESIAGWLPAGARCTGPSSARGLAVSRMGLDVGGVSIDEEAFVLRQADPVFGIATTPADLSKQPNGETAWVVFATNRYSRRIGPNRLYTQWARKWAARGIPSLRLDLSGTGDAGGPDEETNQDMYASPVLDDARMALAFLRERYDARRFVVVGLCSGGYTGLHAALVEPEIAGVALLSPQMLLWTDDATDVSRAHALSTQLVRREAWRILFRHPTAVLRHVVPTLLPAILASTRRHAALLARRVRRMPDMDPINTWITESLDLLTGRGCVLWFVYSGGDEGLGYLERHLGQDYGDFLHQRGVTMNVIEGTDHLFRPIWSQDALQGIVEEHLRACGFQFGDSGTKQVFVPTSTSAAR